MSSVFQRCSLYYSLEYAAKKWPNNTAIAVDNNRITYREFLKNVSSAASILQFKYGLKKDDKIILSVGNEYSFCEVFYAAMSLGIVVIPVSTKLTPDEMTLLLQKITPSWILCHDNHVDKFSSASPLVSELVTLSEWQAFDKENTPSPSLPEIKPIDTAVIMFTSGTTGSPKGAIISHGNILHGISCYQSEFCLTEKDRTILAVPICHVTGLIAILGLFIHIGGTIYLQRKFSAHNILSCIEKESITFMHGSPTVFILLCSELNESKTTYQLTSLNKVVCGGGHLNAGTIESINYHFNNAHIHPVYGLSETSSPASIFSEDITGHRKHGSSGKAIRDVSFRITNSNSQLLPKNQVGELWVKGPVVINSYWNNPKENQTCFKDGWFNTGDLAYIDDDDYLFIQGRSKDMINRGGEKIYSLEVENILSTYPGVIDVALVPIPSDIYGEEPLAFVVADPNELITSTELISWAYGKLSKYKVPKKIIFMEELPRTHNGKISKIELKAIVNNFL